MIILHFDALANPSETLATRQPSIEGRRLWNALFNAYMGRIYMIVDKSYDLELTKGWLKRENYKVSALYQTTDIVRDGSSDRADAVWNVASVLGRPHFYVDSDHKTCELVLKQGIPTILVSVPEFIRPEFRGSQPLRSWDTIVEELEVQALNRSEKEWGSTGV